MQPLTVSTGDIENWTELRTISDNDNETQTVVDTNHQVAGFATIDTRHEVVGNAELRFNHSVRVKNDVEMSAQANNRYLRVDMKAGYAFKDQISVEGTHETMRQLAEAILTALDGEQA